VTNLTPAERELLAIVQHVGDNMKPVARLLKKLDDNFGREAAKRLTNLPEGIFDTLILAIQKNSSPRANQKLKTAQAIEDKTAKKIAVAESKSKGIQGEVFPGNSDLFAEESTGNSSERLAIHLDANSDAINRIAYDITKAIESELSSGDKLWSTREIAVRFATNAAYVSKIYKVLRSHNWIEYVNPDLPGKGYVVK
jgi:DNA-binding transcriptional regulator YhcF (GntR family)